MNSGVAPVVVRGIACVLIRDSELITYIWKISSVLPAQSLVDFSPPVVKSRNSGMPGVANLQKPHKISVASFLHAKQRLSA